jgi:sphingosine kinase
MEFTLNNHSGTLDDPVPQKRGVSIFEHKVRPILAAAGCSMEVIRKFIKPSPFSITTDSPPETTHQKHAYEIIKSIPLIYDAIITVSGDGLIHEVLNGFAHHADPARAFSTPVAPIPTGTGNGLSLNLLGIEVFEPCPQPSFT